MKALLTVAVIGLSLVTAGALAKDKDKDKDTKKDKEKGKPKAKPKAKPRGMPNKKDIPCRCYANGTCTKGMDCPFSHAGPKPLPKKGTDKDKRDQLCHLFAKGACKFGDKCKFKHVCAVRGCLDPGHGVFGHTNKVRGPRANARGHIWCPGWHK